MAKMLKEGYYAHLKYEYYQYLETLQSLNEVLFEDLEDGDDLDMSPWYSSWEQCFLDFEKFKKVIPLVFQNKWEISHNKFKVK
jgi:hypothetical protein